MIGEQVLSIDTDDVVNGHGLPRVLRRGTAFPTLTRADRRGRPLAVPRHDL